MRSYSIFLLLFSIFLIPASNAAPLCGVDLQGNRIASLQSYVAAYGGKDQGVTHSGGGCLIGSTLFSDFYYAGVSTGSNAFTYQSKDVAVVPNGLGFSFLSKWFAGPGDQVLSYLGFSAKTVSSQPTITGSSLRMAGSVAINSGQALALQIQCLGNTVSTAGPQSLFPFAANCIQGGGDIGLLGGIRTAAINFPGFATSFPAVSELSMREAIYLKGGRNGAALLLSVTNRFREVPEPATVIPLLGAAVGVVFLRARRKKAEAFGRKAI